MCRPVSNFSQKRGIFEKLEIMLQIILTCFHFSESINKISNQIFSSKVSVLEANLGSGKIGSFPILYILLAELINCGFYFASHNYSQPYEENSSQRRFYFDLSFSLGMLLKVSENMI
jgi:hypothetical protein